jgi:hypothetical protein
VSRSRTSRYPILMTAPQPAEGAGITAATTCSACHERLTTYYTAGEFIVVCPACREQILGSQAVRFTTGRFFRSALFGAIAAIAVVTVWYAFTRSIGSGLVAVAIAIGLVVGAWMFKRHQRIEFRGPFTR